MQQEQTLVEQGTASEKHAIHRSGRKETWSGEGEHVAIQGHTCEHCMKTESGEKNGRFIGDFVTKKTSVLTQVRELEGSHADMAQMAAQEGGVLGPPTAQSGPSTPHQQASSNPPQQISPVPSQPTREGSPRSLNSESSQTPIPLRRPLRGCRFEAGMTKARRRVPYSLGPERLSADSGEAKKTLGSTEEERLTLKMQELYARLLPTQESEERRNRFISKLESLLKLQWPEKQIKVSVFGSTGNRLGTNDSDIDICISTDCKEIEHVCSIAELLDKNGMERVVCVSSAKVPIVKVWDPELQVACDMNVNNPIALENTDMISSYTMIDDRVRPLAMIVKYWAKRRILNDAALGGTLSSYTWICMVLNFLQTRDPPILPSLQRKSGLEPKFLNGVNVAFDQNISSYKGFGARNTSSLGQLLFQFFRYFGHEFDFEENAVSIRLGKVIPKSQKSWHLLQDNRLCVEEPFNTTRNLANTADDTSMRGIHLELRRAFGLIAGGQLEVSCEQYEARPEERKNTETFIHPTAKTIIPQAPTQPAAQTHRSTRNGYRGGRNSNRNSGRRASNPSGRNSTYLHDLPFQMTPQELQLQAQHQQHLLHDQLFQQYQYLQHQEQELRMQLYQQSLRQRGLMSGQATPQTAFGSTPNTDSSATQPSGSPMRMPMSPNVFQNRFGNASPFLRNASPASGIMTNPASPLLAAVVPDGRRYTRRTSVTNSSPAGSLRAHSQPARSIPFGMGYGQARQANDPNMEYSELISDRRTSIAMYPNMFGSGFAPPSTNGSGTLYEAGRRPAEYMGYYVGQSPSLPAISRNSAVSPIPFHAGLAIHNGGLSPKLSSRSSILPSVTSSPSLQSANLEDASESVASGELVTESLSTIKQAESPKARSGPLIVDGSVYSPQRRRPTIKASFNGTAVVNMSASTSSDAGLDTPSSSDDQSNDYRGESMPNHEAHNDTGMITDSLAECISNVSVIPKGPARSFAPVLDTAVSNDVNGTTALRARTQIFSAPSTHDRLATSPAEHMVNGVGSKKKKPNAGRVASIGLESSGEVNGSLVPKTNGQDSNSASPMTFKQGDISGGWQTQKKKKRSKKATKSENDNALINHAGGEILPLDESLRKGG